MDDQTPTVTLSSPFFLSQDPFLAEMLQNNKDQIVCYHEHDSLLDHKEEEELSEEERKAAWAEYEAEKKVGGGDPRTRPQRHTDTPGAMDELDEPVGPP